MTIEFVNHSSVIIHFKQISLICDPWLEDPVFQDGWNHLAPSKFKFSDFKKITHIWFSHEHPDHFFPPNIKRIEEEYRKQITVFYHKTKDKKVVDYLLKLGFKEIIELEKDQWYSIMPGFKIMCNPFGHDSWLCLKTDNKSILNTNDCVINEYHSAQEIINKIGKIDILLTQFGYGQYEGNFDESHKRKIAVQAKFNQINIQIAVFKPEFLIPFASFIYFCHEENYFMNDEINRVEYVYNYYKLSNSVEPVIMYIGTTWNVQTVYTESLKSIEKWNFHYNNLIESPTLIKTKIIPIEKILEAGNLRLYNLSQNINISKSIKKLPVLFIYLTDVKKYVILSYNEIYEVEKLNYQIEFSSEVLFYCLKYDWGFNTTHVNARVQFYNNGYSLFMIWERLFNNLNHNQKESNLINRLINKIKKAIKSLLVIFQFTKTNNI